MLDGVFLVLGKTISSVIVLERLGGPEKGLFGVSSHDKDLMKANLLIWAESAG